MKPLTSYITGFILSLILTLTAFAMVNAHVTSRHLVFPHTFLTAAVLTLAIIQLCVQIIFFLHLTTERKPRFQFWTFFFALQLVLIIVVASNWIMSNLNYNHMSGMEMDAYIVHDEGIQK